MLGEDVQPGIGALLKLKTPIQKGSGLWGSAAVLKCPSFQKLHRSVLMGQNQQKMFDTSLRYVI
jgi:hypothetical protein